MSDQDNKDDANKIAVTDSAALARRSASIARRGLLTLSIADMARVIEAGKALTSSLGLYDVFAILKERANEVLGTDRWSLLRIDPDKEELYYKIANGKELYSDVNGEAAEALNKIRIPIGAGITGWVAKNLETAIVPDVRTDLRYRAEFDGRIEPETHSLVTVPLVVRDSCLGVIQLINCVGRDGFSQTDLSVLRTFADYAAIAIGNAQQVLATHEQSLTDELTGLYNARHLRFMLDTEIYRSKRNGHSFSVVMVDIESFLNASMAMSWHALNQLLAALGQKIKATCRLIDLAFYLGDGEFALLLPTTSKSDAEQFALKLRGALQDPGWLSPVTRPASPTFHVGVLGYPEDSDIKTEVQFYSLRVP
jgi:diguanylate cyclase (GGDEF)-like protein